MMNLIVATDKNGMMAKDGNLPWKCSADLKSFKALTMNNNIIMGRTTFMSLPVKLKDRQHFVLTRKADFSQDKEFFDKVLDNNVIVRNSIDSFKKKDFNKTEVAYTKYNYLDFELTKKIQSGENFVIGGKEIYELFLKEDLIDRIYYSIIDTKVEPNETSLYFDFEKVAVSDFALVNQEDREGYTFQVWER